MKKKILAISLVVSLVAVAALGVTLAYFTDTKTVDNTFTMGNVAINLTEPNFAGGTAGGTIDGVAPGDVIPKDPIITNIGDNEAWVFMKLTLSDEAAFAQLLPSAENAITAGIINFDLTSASPWKVYSNEAGANDTRVFWIGYKTKLLAADDPATTTVLENVTVAPFTTINVPSSWDNDAMESFGEDGITLTVEAHAIQADNIATLDLAYGQVNP